MLIFPEIQISGGQVVTRLSPAANNIVHPITRARRSASSRPRARSGCTSSMWTPPSARTP